MLYSSKYLPSSSHQEAYCANIAPISADLPYPNGVICASKVSYMLKSMLKKQGKTGVIEIDTNLTRGTCYCKLEQD
jgi:hypothetical protein